MRDAMKADPDGTLAAVRAIGYTDVELLWSFNNFGRTPEQVRASLRHLGLHAPSAHIAPESLLTNWQESLDRANYLGHQYLIVPSLPSDTRTVARRVASRGPTTSIGRVKRPAGRGSGWHFTTNLSIRTRSTDRFRTTCSSSRPIRLAFVCNSMLAT